MKPAHAFFVLCTVLVLTLAACQQAPPPEQAMWNGTLELPGQKQLPFLVFLDLKQPAPSGYFLNGSEQTPIPEIYYHGDSVTFVFSEYGAAMRGIWKSGKLTGEYLRFRKDTVVNKFEATPVASVEKTQPSKTSAEIPLVGKFQAYFMQKEGIDSSSQATFWAHGDSVYGTVVESSGDLGLMAGKQIGNLVVLSRFTGWQGQMVELKRVLNSWSGTLYYRIPPPVSFTLEPRATLIDALPAAKRPSMKEQRKPFVFSGTTVMGDTLSNLSPQFKGKVLILDIMGTWCHNCMDAAPLLQKLYSEFGSQGVEIVGLSFELGDDPVTARRNLLLYEERYGITFPVLFCGSTASANVDARVKSQLNNFPGYPTTLFVDRNGVVRHIHGGFNGPGTGEYFQAQVNQYYDLVRSLLKEKKSSHAYPTVP
jgi:thiol-disulfide isomerase/thioredoxin